MKSNVFSIYKSQVINQVINDLNAERYARLIHRSTPSTFNLTEDDVKSIMYEAVAKVAGTLPQTLKQKKDGSIGHFSSYSHLYHYTKNAIKNLVTDYKKTEMADSRGFTLTSTMTSLTTPSVEYSADMVAIHRSREMTRSSVTFDSTLEYNEAKIQIWKHLRSMDSDNRASGVKSNLARVAVALINPRRTTQINLIKTLKGMTVAEFTMARRVVEGLLAGELRDPALTILEYSKYTQSTMDYLARFGGVNSGKAVSEARKSAQQSSTRLDEVYCMSKENGEQVYKVVVRLVVTKDSSSKKEVLDQREYSVKATPTMTFEDAKKVLKTLAEESIREFKQFVEDKKDAYIKSATTHAFRQIA